MVMTTSITAQTGNPLDPAHTPHCFDCILSLFRFAAYAAVAAFLARRSLPGHARQMHGVRIDRGRHGKRGVRLIRELPSAPHVGAVRRRRVPRVALQVWPLQLLLARDGGARLRCAQHRQLLRAARAVPGAHDAVQLLLHHVPRDGRLDAQRQLPLRRPMQAAHEADAVLRALRHLPARVCHVGHGTRAQAPAVDPLQAGRCARAQQGGGRRRGG
mmetsp:Transcript_24576/g.79050  ORF Transcript_24576/g.79050 Transcript_24576/m.79050 type:complete len:215 (+) Transcript_24576:13-657(+)